MTRIALGLTQLLILGWAVLALLFPAAPPVAAAPAPVVVHWAPAPIFDQGPTPYCVPFALKGWALTGPQPWGWTFNTTTLYWASRHYAGLADNAADGTFVESAAALLELSGRAEGLSYASTEAEAEAFLASVGPLLVYGPWFSGLNWLDADGFVTPVGNATASHAFYCSGHDAAGWDCVQSWGYGWGQGGHFRFTDASFADYLARGARAVELRKTPLYLPRV